MSEVTVGTLAEAKLIEGTGEGTEVARARQHPQPLPTPLQLRIVKIYWVYYLQYKTFETRITELEIKRTHTEHKYLTQILTH